MPRQCKKILKKKTINRSKGSRVSRSIPLNNNALNESPCKNEICPFVVNSRFLANVVLYLESIGNSIINEIKGLESVHLKQQFPTSTSVPNATTMQCTSYPSMRRDLEEIFTNFHALEDHTQRQYRTVATGDDDIHENVPIIQSQIEESNKPMVSKGRPGPMNSENEAKKKPNSTLRTICTRSSTLNRLKNPPQE